ncbi:DUF6286 domain-containing protein [Arthrobacter luteolus]|uniref:DUF6286 domain-containing protein n=1 Tax=Arthrobacter luteolus TaxID=98672 RepID=UPI00082A9CE1|nr:DUF6286 domain-containing protein [Arthrobacter luteolus]
MSRPGAPPVALRQRPSRSVPATICAAVLLALGIVLVWVALVRLTSGSWPEAFIAPFTWVAGVSWNDPAVWTIGAAVAAAGLILLLAGILPGRFRDLGVRLPAADEADSEAAVEGDASVVMSSRAVAQLAAATCEHIDGVSSASATATDREVRVSVNTALHDTRDLHRWVGDGVRSRLVASGLDPAPRVKVFIRSRD